MMARMCVFSSEYNNANEKNLESCVFLLFFLFLKIKKLHAEKKVFLNSLDSLHEPVVDRNDSGFHQLGRIRGFALVVDAPERSGGENRRGKRKSSSHGLQKLHKKR
jgi:hypothetical protein